MLLEFSVIGKLFEVKVHLVPSLVLFGKRVCLQHLFLKFNGSSLINKRNQASSLPGQSSPIQINIKVSREKVDQLSIGNGVITIRQQFDASSWHNGEQLLERCVRHIHLWAIGIDLEAFNGNLPTKEVLDNTLIYVRYHRCIMVRIIPSPMLGSSVIVVEDPLKTFDVLHKHLFLELYSFGGGHIHFQFLFVVETLGCCRILWKQRDKLIHEL